MFVFVGEHVFVLQFDYFLDFDLTSRTLSPIVVSVRGSTSKKSRGSKKGERMKVQRDGDKFVIEATAEEVERLSTALLTEIHSGARYALKDEPEEVEPRVLEVLRRANAELVESYSRLVRDLGIENHIGAL